MYPNLGHSRTLRKLPHTTKSIFQLLKGKIVRKFNSILTTANSNRIYTFLLILILYRDLLYFNYVTSYIPCLTRNFYFIYLRKEELSCLRGRVANYITPKRKANMNELTRRRNPLLREVRNK